MYTTGVIDPTKQVVKIGIFITCLDDYKPPKNMKTEKCLSNKLQLFRSLYITS